MNRKVRLSLLAALALIPGPNSAQQIGSAAREIHSSALVIDTHADTPFRIHYDHFDLANPDPRDPAFVTLDRAKTREPWRRVLFDLRHPEPPGQELFAGSDVHNRLCLRSGCAPSGSNSDSRHGRRH